MIIKKIVRRVVLAQSLGVGSFETVFCWRWKGDGSGVDPASEKSLVMPFSFLSDDVFEMKKYERAGKDYLPNSFGFTLLSAILS